MKVSNFLRGVLCVSLLTVSSVAGAYSPNEIITETFGTNGTKGMLTFVGPGGSLEVKQIIAIPNNKFLAVASNSSDSIYLYQFDSNGPDTSFGTRGTAKITMTTDLTAPSYIVSNLVYDNTNSKILIGGSAIDASITSQNIFVAQINSNGTLDTNFNSKGFIIDLAHTSSTEYLRDMGLKDSTLYLSGNTLDFSASDTDYFITTLTLGNSPSFGTFTTIDAGTSKNGIGTRTEDSLVRTLGDSTGTYAYLVGAIDKNTFNPQINITQIQTSDLSVVAQYNGFVFQLDLLDATFDHDKSKIDFVFKGQGTGIFLGRVNTSMQIVGDLTTYQVSNTFNGNHATRILSSASTDNIVYLAGTYDVGTDTDVSFTKIDFASAEFPLGEVTTFSNHFDLTDGTSTSTDLGQGIVADGSGGFYLAGMKGSDVAFINVFGDRTCGNAIYTGEEELNEPNTATPVFCDDGNLTSHDGCSTTCQVEYSYCLDEDGDNYSLAPVYLGLSEIHHSPYELYVDCIQIPNAELDCNDANPDSYPGGPKLCALKNETPADYNCDGTDESYCNSDSDSKPDNIDNCPVNTNEDQADIDGDGYGDACDPPECGNGFIETGEQCDKGSHSNGPQSDCSIDCKEQTLFYADGDGDGYVLSTAFSKYAVTKPEGFAPLGGIEDCDDTNSARFPGNPEVCGDGIDQDCNNKDLACDTDGDGLANEHDNCPLVSNIDQADGDQDGIGDLCDPQTCGDGNITGDEDCEDGNTNSLDGCSSLCHTEYLYCADGDQDGYSPEPNNGTMVDHFIAENPPAIPGHSAHVTLTKCAELHSTDTDCDDNDNTIYPGATESCADTSVTTLVDYNCDGTAQSYCSETTGGSTTGSTTGDTTGSTTGSTSGSGTGATTGDTSGSGSSSTGGSSTGSGSGSSTGSSSGGSGSSTDSTDTTDKTSNAKETGGSGGCSLQADQKPSAALPFLILFAGVMAPIQWRRRV